MSMYVMVELYLACDGEDLFIAPRHPADDCEQISTTWGFDNEGASEPRWLDPPNTARKGLVSEVDTMLETLEDRGWIREPVGRDNLHLCESCAKVYATMTGEERELARDRWVEHVHRKGVRR